MLYTHQLVCKCRTALRFFQQSLGLPSFCSASAFHSHDSRRALRLACMKASLTPTCADQTQAWSDWRSVSLLLQSSTAPEARPHQFHMLHLCQQMMDPRSHLVNRTFLKNYTLTTSIVAERSSTLKSNLEQILSAISAAKSIPTPFLRDFLNGKQKQSYTGWWFQPLWKILVSWGYYSQCMEKWNSCSKPPTSIMFHICSIYSYSSTPVSPFPHSLPVLWLFSRSPWTKPVMDPGGRWLRSWLDPSKYVLKYQVNISRLVPSGKLTCWPWKSQIFRGN